MYASASDLPSATTYHGMFAHVHSTGKGYFAHAGNWVELVDDNDIGTSANQIVQLDSNAKIPAVDGSQITNLNNNTSISAGASYASILAFGF